jgi:hypothetical protein
VVGGPAGRQGRAYKCRRTPARCTGGRGPQPFHPVVGEDGVDYPAVVLRRLAPHQARPPHPFEKPGQTARAVDDCPRELAHLEPAAPCLGEAQQDIVLGQRDARLVLHLPFEHGRQPEARSRADAQGEMPKASARRAKWRQ